MELPFRVQRATVALLAQATNRVMAESPGLITPKAKAPWCLFKGTGPSDNDACGWSRWADFYRTR